MDYRMQCSGGHYTLKGNAVTMTATRLDAESRKQMHCATGVMLDSLTLKATAMVGATGRQLPGRWSAGRDPADGETARCNETAACSAPCASLDRHERAATAFSCPANDCG